MAASANSNDEDISGINVTPLVDIMLVLLCIFMATTTLKENEAIPVELPTAAKAGLVTPGSLTITIGAEGQMAIKITSAGSSNSRSEEVNEQQLIGEVKTLMARPENKELQALISADKNAKHGVVIHVVDILKQNNITKFAFEIEKA